eukprot:GHVO01040382.1.p1 GENE.GHVO01040382.1~~GHVO01040382.1.p1  ORF type:complete len:215 (-),score=26.29 GHVO01040382.1:168-812(-)
MYMGVVSRADSEIPSIQYKSDLPTPAGRVKECVAHLLKELTTKDGVCQLPDDELRQSAQTLSSVLQKMTSGYTMNDIDDPCLPNDDKECNLVSRTDIVINLLCKESLLPVIGKCCVSYIPDHHVIGATRLNRIIQRLSRRIQVQQTLTDEIATAIDEVAHPKGVAVIITARHFSQNRYGVIDSTGLLTTECMTGLMKDDEALQMQVRQLPVDNF